MNAPKEYYPVGYEKNFDDNFKSKIDLPATSFYCGDQKHFPGLYGDQDLGCMVSLPRTQSMHFLTCCAYSYRQFPVSIHVSHHWIKCF